MPDQSERKGYAIKPEEQRLMVEAGVQWYLDTKKEFGEAFEPDLIFEDERFLNLPAEVQKELRAEIVKREKVEVKAEVTPGLAQITKPPEIPAVETAAVPLKSPEKQAEAELVGQAQRAMAAVRNHATLKYAVDLLLEAKRPKDAHDFLQQLENKPPSGRIGQDRWNQWINQQKRRIMEIKKVAYAGEESTGAEEAPSEEQVRRFRQYPIRELLSRAGIDSHKTADDFIRPRVKQLSEKVAALRKTIKQMPAQECEYYLKQAGLEQTFENDFDIEEVEDIFKVLQSTAEPDLPPSWREERGLMLQYLEDILPGLRYLAQHSFAMREDIRGAVEKRRMILLKEKPLGREILKDREIIPLDQGRILDALLEAGVVVELAENEDEERGIEPIRAERPIKEVLSDLDRSFANFQIRASDIEKRIATLSEIGCAVALGESLELWRDPTAGTVWIKGAAGDISKLQFEYLLSKYTGYTEAAYEKLQALKSDLQRKRVNPEEEENLEYWQNYVSEVEGKTAQLRKSMLNRIDELIDKAQARRTALRVEREERIWQKDKLPGVIISEVARVEEEIKAQYGDKIDPKKFTQLVHCRALNDGKHNIRDCAEKREGKLTIEQTLAIWEGVLQKLEDKYGIPFTEDDLAKAKAARQTGKPSPKEERLPPAAQKFSDYHAAAMLVLERLLKIQDIQEEFTKEETVWNTEGHPGVVKRIEQQFKEWRERKKIPERNEWWQNRQLFKRAMTDAEETVLRRVARGHQAGIDADTPRDVDRWQKVIQHFRDKLEPPYSEHEIKAATGMVAREREEQKDAFVWRRSEISGNVLAKWLGMDAGKIPKEITAQKLLEYLGLDKGEEKTKALLGFLDHLEALRRIPEGRIVADLARAMGIEREPRKLYETLPHLWGVPVPLSVNDQGKVMVQWWWQVKDNPQIKKEVVYVNIKPELARQIRKNERYYIVPTRMEVDFGQGRRTVQADFYGHCVQSGDARELEEAMKNTVARRLNIPKAEAHYRVKSEMWLPYYRAAWNRFLEIKRGQNN